MPRSRPASGAYPVTRPNPGQPLTATWDPPAGSASAFEDLGNPVSRFIATYGWRAYAIPVLFVLTVVLMVMTVRGGEADGAADNASPDAGPNTQIVTESAPVGAPTGNIAESALPVGALPPGGHFTREGRKTFHVVPVAGKPKKAGTGARLFTYTVEVEDGLVAHDFSGDRAFASMVEATLANKKSWIGGGKVSFQRVGPGNNPDLRISLTSTNTARALCGYQIKLESSCFYPPTHQVIINEARWVRGAISFAGDTHSYRQYLINHEVGHGIGYEAHEPCKQDGALAPIMMQQSFGTANKDIMALDPDMNANRALSCKPNPWPFP
ncbi:DUF3152 domain-containing protein [Gordonia araii NBRC 100433]|nr:DUF3152 domain-containing protein [Gordonia araii]NNG97553.1 DUF3152 domain-containing protein [Gordonia araii NBRC 100433]